ncbi:hypothetical protein NHX12_031477 [Muraenolepis orangiensis]|uniref:CXXC-type domain-containing protein n=1 Tax=Muraenolepis orangiensis TaxID=630683 RepID=A0A9Q0E746_9TELE|nr:hypothetical protein NHX12_031477 [Muraenolepis orangiensis]
MSGSKALGGGAGGGARRRRTRCRRCQACMRTECGECHFCKDMKKFGGPGRMKQSCLLRQCTAMGKAEGIINDEIPNCWECPKCHKEGKTSKDQADGSGKRRLDNGEVGRWKLTDDPPPKKKAPPSSSLEDGGRSDGAHKRKKEKEQPQDSGPKKKIKGAHEKRLKKKPKTETSESNGPGSSGGAGGGGAGGADQRSHHREKLERFKRMCQLLERLPESSSSSSSSSESDSESDSDDSSREPGGVSVSVADKARRRGGGEGGVTQQRGRKGPVMVDGEDEEETLTSDRTRKNSSSLPPPSPLSSNQTPPSSGYSDGFTGKQRSNGQEARNGRTRGGAGPSRLAPRSQMMKRSPPAVPSPPRPVQMERHLVRPPPACPEPSCLPLDSGASHIMTRDAWMRVFQYLSQRELCVCMRVCRTWSRWCCDKRLWTQIDLSRQRSITPPMLSGIIRRQPVSLNLGYTNISKKQLMWLINRLQALCQAVCPCLKLLDLSRVEELKDSHLRELLAPPPDTRTAHGETRGGRFQNATELRLAGLDLTDASSRLLVRYVPHLAKLDLSQCGSITDQTIHTLTSPISPLRDALTHINLAGCVKVTEQCVPLLRRCASLQTVDLRSCSLLSSDSGQLLSFSHHPSSTCSSSSSSSSSSAATTTCSSSSSSSSSSSVTAVAPPAACPSEDRTLLKNS